MKTKWTNNQSWTVAVTANSKATESRKYWRSQSQDCGKEGIKLIAIFLSLVFQVFHYDNRHSSMSASQKMILMITCPLHLKCKDSKEATKRSKRLTALKFKHNKTLLVNKMYFMSTEAFMKDSYCHKCIILWSWLSFHLLPMWFIGRLRARLKACPWDWVMSLNFL